MSLPDPPTTVASALSRSDVADPGCPFCSIATAFPPPSTPLAPPTPSPNSAPFLDPQAHIIVSTSSVIAFLDIMPLTRCHVLVCPRRHVEKLSSLRPSESGIVGAWLAVIARAVKAVSGVEDFNVVQNNGINAAQVVPHVHYHIIPRPNERQREDMVKRQEEAGRTAYKGFWKSPFGDGWRTDLDDDNGALLAKALREHVYAEVEAMEKEENGRQERKLLANL